MDKIKRPRRLLYRFLDYREKIYKGNQWIAVVEEYVPIQKGIDIATTYFAVKLAVDHKSWLWIAGGISLYVGYKIFWELMRFVIGEIYWRKNVWKAEIEWANKNDKYRGPEVEKRKTISAIADKLGAENYIKDLDE